MTHRKADPVAVLLAVALFIGATTFIGVCVASSL